MPLDLVNLVVQELQDSEDCQERLVQLDPLDLPAEMDLLVPLAPQGREELLAVPIATNVRTRTQDANTTASIRTIASSVPVAMDILSSTSPSTALEVMTNDIVLM